MKIPEKKISGVFPDKPNGYILLENRLLVPPIPFEGFAMWGYLLYSTETASQVSYDLAYRIEISEN